MASNKSATRVNGKNGEYLRLNDDELCFHTRGKVERMPVASLTFLSVTNTEEARDAVNKTDLVPHGAWTEKMPSSGGKSAYLVAKGRVSCWVMEISKAQVPNAQSFVQGIRPSFESDEDKFLIPNRAINTPLGGVFTIGSILCVFLAIFFVFNLQMPILGIVVAIAAILMFVNVK